MSPSSKSTLTIVVAETAPIIRTGIVDCLHRLQLPHAHVIEAKDYSDLLEGVTVHAADIAIVNPTFCGSFDPVTLRKRGRDNLRIAALAAVMPDQRVARLYDAIIALTDDLETIGRRISAMTADENASGLQKNDILSDREREVITHVVRGLTNQEIAERLFLSVHTVMTHRRNIARKLDIHSATGLTIYAIVNGLVDISEIQL